MSTSGSKPILDEFKGQDRELAERLLDLRRPPSAALQRRVQSIPRRRTWPVQLLPRLAWASVALVVLALLFISPTAEAMLSQVEQFIGRVHLMVVDTRPSPTATVVVESTPMSLEAARTVVPFEVIMPTYLPSKLAVEREVYVTELETPIMKIRWSDRADGYVQLSAHALGTADNTIPTRIGPESSRTISINGHEAVIVYGAWDQTSRTWSYRDQVVTLIWEVDGIQYHLLSVSRAVPLSELIKMAQSVH